MRGIVATALTGAVLLSGCGTGSDTNSQMVRTGTPKITQRADGKLTREPSPLTLQDVNRVEAGVRRTVLEELFWAQWGSWPDIADGYHPQVRSAVGRENLTGAYSLLRAQLASSRPRFASVRFARGRATVQLELLTTTGRPSPESFVLRRVGKRWFIVSDTLLERGLKTFVTQRIDGDAAGLKASRKASRAGIEAAARYRAAYAKAANRKPDPVPRGGPASESPTGSPVAGDQVP